ncbi:hypothetical protein DWG18_07840 [Lysobacter sp. TY2-98]|uniref:hypothetical protein n=1 Tax=Lysobacter sp. TY2-98 TaxID=2290922 RepID=UPI000E204A52|nr:hypothetical protein [Lysobacter sp. TY2-98]AXK72202.1 hypothetical protein DWG18_07840 [Lysobacter sp. TY2-98]
MKKYEVLYDWLYAQITHLSDSPAAETFAAGLVGPAQDEFVTLTETLRNFGAEVAGAKAGRALLGRWGEIAVALDEFGRRFPTFPDFRRDLLIAFCCVAGWLCVNHAPVLDAADVDETAFTVHGIPGVELAPAWFLHENARQPNESLVVFDSRDLATFEAGLASAAASQELAFAFLAALAVAEPVVTCPCAVVKKSNPQLGIKEIEAFVELHLAMAGLPTHTPRRISRTPAVVDKDSVRAESAYHQWADVLRVLSEYNSRDELLLKYLTIYHVIENLMFKMPIVDLERQRNGSMFSIRDFRRLYDSVSLKELPALEKLFETAFDLHATSVVKYGKLVRDTWSALVAAHGSAAINSALQRLGYEKSASDFSGQRVHGNYAKLVYIVRNSIVHNKETEFHLTSQSLSAEISQLIEEFLLPTLEQIAFGMIGIPNGKLWYGRKELVLY